MTSVVSITLDDTTLNLTETAVVTIVFSEDIDPATLDVSDFVVGGGTLSNLTTADNITWTAIFTPDAETQSAANVITLADNSFFNLAGDPSTGGSSANYAVDTGVFQLSSLDGSNGLVLNGMDDNDQSGYSVSSAGDVNGDGYDDILIGAVGADPSGNFSAGESYIIFGQATGFEASLDLSTLNGSNGFVLNGIDGGDSSGSSISSAGDVNGDGYDDILIGAQGGDPHGNSNAGESYVVFGQAGGFDTNFDLSTLNGSNGFILNGINNGDQVGSSVSSAGDVNGDGYDDILIGALGGDPHGNSNAGESYVVFGQASGFAASLDLSTLNGSNGFVLNGIDGGDSSGSSVSSAGDVNGDGYDDILIGAWAAAPNGNSLAGESYVVFGQASGFAPSLDLSGLNGSDGFALNGINNNDRSGFSVSSAGDVNGDGYDDILIGATFADPNGNSGAGESYVIFGKASGFAASFDLTALNGSNGFVLNGIDSGDTSGFSVSSAGDVNGDGYDDILIGAWGADPNGNNLAGESYVVFGQASGFTASLDLSTLNGSNGFVLNGINSGDQSGRRSVSSAGDVNGDGYDDMLIGAWAADPNDNSLAGESYVIFGSATFGSAPPSSNTLFGTPDADTLIGTAGNDIIDALAGDDIVQAGDGEDTVYGREGNDNLDGGTGDDVLNGGDGDDILNAGAGADAHDGGAGNDVVSYYDSNAAVTVNLSANTAYGGSAEGDSFINIEIIVGSNGFDDVITGDTNGNYLLGYGGNDTLNGGGGIDSLEGNEGDDTLNGGSGDDYLVGGAGADALDGGDGADTIGYIASNAGVSVNLAMNTASGGEAEGDSFTNIANVLGSNGFDDILTGDANDNIFFGYGGNDTLTGGGGNDRLEGYEGNDALFGGAGNDFLDGGIGDDILSGGEGDDVIQTSGGNDIIIIERNGGVDTVVNFEVGVDLINVFAFSESEVSAALADYKAGTTSSLLLPTGSEVIFSGIDIQSLSMSDFSFDNLTSPTSPLVPETSLAQILDGNLSTITSNLAIFSEAAYDEQNALDLLTDAGWVLYSHANKDYFSGLGELADIEPLGDNPSYALDGEYIIESGNAQIILGRTSDALVISFTGTDTTDGADIRNWFSQDNYVERLVPLMNQILVMVSEDETLTDVYFTGHSLGAAMSEIFYTTYRSAFESIIGTTGGNRGLEVHGQNFASPGYNGSAIDEVADIVLSALVGLALGGIPGAALGALKGFAELIIESSIQSLIETLTNANSKFLSVWVDGDVIRGGSFLSDNIGQPFEVELSENSMRGGIASLHSQDLYANVISAVDSAIVANPELQSVLEAQSLLDNGQIFFDYDRMIIRAEYLGENAWGVGQEVLDSGQADFLTVSLNVSNARHILVGHGGADFINGGSSSDLIFGLDGNDFIEPDPFFLNLGSTLIDNGFQPTPDIIDGGTGSDTVSYRDNAGVSVDLRSTDGHGGGAEGDSLYSIENVDGSNNYDDQISGNDTANILRGSGGNDTLYGYGGADKLYADDVRFDIGNDQLYGGADNDSLYTEGGNDRLYGGEDDDSYYVGRLSSLSRIVISETLNESNNDRLILDESYSKNDIVFSYSDGNLIITIRGDALVSFFGFGFKLDHTITVIDGSQLALLEEIVFASGESSINLALALSNFRNGIGTDISDYFIADSGGQILSGAAGLDTVDLSQIQNIGNSAAVAKDNSSNSAVQASSNISGITVMFAETGLATVSSSNFSDITLVDIENVILTELDDYFIGDDRDNTITAGQGNDEIRASGGNDVIIETPGGGDDIYDGQDGFDLVDYSASQSDLLIDLGATANNASGVDIGLDQLISIQSVLTGEGNDQLAGDTFSNYFDGGFGDDLIDGRAGDDVLLGSHGNDHITGGSGADIIDGGAGVDTASYGDAASGVVASLRSGITATGDAAGDILTSIENLEGSSFGDTLWGDNAANTIMGGDGNDFLRGQGGDDVLDGGFGVDYLRGGAGADELRGYAGQDWADYITSNAGVTVNLLTNTASGGDAEGDTFFLVERVYGSSHDDHITGDNGVNYLRGWSGDDQLFGGAGNDYLQGGLGADTLDGGAGSNDWAYYVSSTIGLTLNLGDSSLNTGEAIGDTYISIENIVGSRHDDNITGDSHGNFLRGLQGDDTLNGGDGNDFLRGEQGADVHDGGAGADWAYYATNSTAVTIDLGANTASGGDATGDSFISIERVYGSRYDDSITGDSAANYLRGYFGNDTLIGGDGNDFLQGDAGADTLNGGNGSDWAYYASSQNGLIINLGDASQNTGEASGDSYISIENVFGTKFNDTITGDSGDNYLRGFSGDDIINGDAGNDTLRGEAGADTFVFEAGTGSDTVIDYNDAEDMLDFTAFGAFGNINPADYAVEVDGDVIITIGTDVIIIENTTILEISDNVIL